MIKGGKIFKIPALVLLCFGVALPLAACGGDGNDDGGVTDRIENTDYNSGYDADGADIDDIAVPVPETGGSLVTDDDKQTSTDGAAEATGETVSVTEGGVYRLSGDYGGVTVSAADEVRLIFDNANIISSSASPVKIKKNSGKVIITLMGDNTVTDSSAEGEDAAIYSATADLTLNGEGSLTVTTASNHGIQSKGTLIVVGGDITVNAADNGLAGNTALELEGGTFDITAGGDAVKSKNGGVRISGSSITANAACDGVDAETYAIVDNADIDLTTGGGSTGDSGMTTSAAWAYETLAESDFEEYKTYYTLSGSTYSEYESASFRDGLYDRASCKGIKGYDVTVNGGNVLLDCLDDGINADGAAVVNGDVTVSTACDGIQGDAGVTISGGAVDIKTIGAFVRNSDGNYTKSGNTYTRVDGDEMRGVTLYDYANSCKGIKSDIGVVISGGNIAVNSSDKAIKADGDIKISGGTLNLQTPDHCVHAEGTLHVTGGTVSITNAYDGLKGGRTYIDGGIMRVKSNDDGVSGAGGDTFDGYIEINGGNLYVNASGDGLDSNGNLVINGGIIVIDGPTDGGNGALDSGDGNYSIRLNGGMLVAAGSSQMTESPASSSEAYSIVVNASLSANTCLTVSTESGSLTYLPSKSVQSIVICSPLLSGGGSVTVSTGGTLVGADMLFGSASGANGLYSGGTLSSSTQLSSVNLSQKVTTIGSSSGQGGGGGGFRPRGAESI